MNGSTGQPAAVGREVIAAAMTAAGAQAGAEPPGGTTN
jgi:hypothetical protein